MKLQLPKNRRVIWDLTKFGLPEVPLFGAYNAIHAETSLPPHTHGDCMEIHYFKRGHQVFTVGEKIYNVRGGDIFVTFPGETHGTAGHPLRGAIYWMQIRLPSHSQSFLGLRGNDVTALVRELSTLKTRHFPATHGIPELFEDTFLFLERPGSSLTHAGLGMRIALWLMTVVDSANASTTRTITADIKNAMDMIENEQAAILSVDKMARHVGLPKITFQLRFKKQVGISPHDYILDRTIARAVELLRNSTDSITDIAYRLGFCNSQYFSTVFRRYIGMTPAAYRQGGTGPKRRYNPDERVVLAD